MNIDFETLGCVSYIEALPGVVRRGRPLDPSILWPAVWHERLRIAFDEEGLPVGYFLWATLAEDVFERLRRTPDAWLHESEWNEGEQPWIVAAVALPEVQADLLFEISRVFENSACIAYLSFSRRSGACLRTRSPASLRNMAIRGMQATKGRQWPTFDITRHEWLAKRGDFRV
jgi:hemolysin-activating ACP:hemolysin acyltransferase